MGTEGKAREMVCPGCMSPELICLSRVKEEKREIGWFCKSCCRCCEYEKAEGTYDNVPWEDECVTEQCQVPADPKFRLRGELGWDEFMQMVRQLPNRKAAGDNLVPAELWKHAPDWALRTLFDTINKVLMGDMTIPEHWKGGQVQFLFKKQLAVSISNWRPLCLANVSYRLFSSILARRLDKVAEAYGILDQIQEAFRRGRGTRRQAESLIQLIQAANLQGCELIVAYLDFKNAFNSIDVQACIKILKAYNLPDLDLLEQLYSNAYYEVRTSDGNVTSRIPLTLGTKQGDPLSPIIFNLTINMLFRMIARTGHAFALKPFGCKARLRVVNCKAFADDTTLLANNVAGANAMLFRVAAFCDYTGMEVRPEKCEITGMNFNTDTPLDVSRVQYRGTCLPLILPSKATRYLGFHISLSLDWRREKQYVVEKMTHAVEQLRKTCYTRSQVMMLFRTCVIPIFRYSAALVPWTDSELYEIDKLWSRAVKYSLHLPLSFNLAPILLDRAQGGMGLEPASNFMLKEIQIHVRQCLQMGGAVNELVMESCERVMTTLRMYTAQDVYKVGASRLVKNLLTTAPVFCMHALLKHTYWGELDWMKCTRPYGKPLASVVRDWLASIEPDPGQVAVPVAGPVAEHASAVMKVLVVMHRAGFFTVQSLRADHGWGLKEHKGLLAEAQKCITSTQYNVFVQCITGNPTAQRITIPRRASISALLQSGDHPRVGVCESLPALNSKAWEQLEGLIWDEADMASKNDSVLWHIVCKYFGTSLRTCKLYFGVVVAQTHPEDDTMLFRIVYQDGDVEDCDYPEMEAGVELYFDTGCYEQGNEANVALATKLAEHWQQCAGTAVSSQRARLRSSLKGVIFAVIIPQQDQGGKQWSEMCYRYTNPLHDTGPVYMCKQLFRDGRLMDDPSHEAFVMFPWKPLGSLASVHASLSGEVSVEECSRLQLWYNGNMSEMHAAYSEQLPLSSDRCRITSYFPASVKRGREVYPESVGEASTSTAQPVWSGHNLKGEVKFDWESMNARVESNYPYLRVARSGKWIFYRTQADSSSACVTDGPLTLGKQKLVKTHYAGLGEMDMRVAGGTLALADAADDWTLLLQYVHQSHSADGAAQAAQLLRPKHLHWIFCERLRVLTKAKQFVGSPPNACSFGFDTVVHGSEPSPLTKVLKRMDTVVWLNGVEKDRVGVLRLLQKFTSNNVVVVMSSGLRQQMQTRKCIPKQWCKVTSFPAGTRIMLSANQFDLKPKASIRVLEVWANIKAGHCNNFSLIGEFVMTDSPLLDIHNMSGGRWQHFHNGSQDYKYQEFDGIVAATDGSVIDDPDEGPCMGGGVVFRAGDHGLKDEWVRAHGHISSLVAEGAAACVLLSMVPPDKPLAILTDSANIMFAMQHCSRREIWRDFSGHVDAQLIEELARLQARRTAPTVWIKVKLHTSVELNERADRFAAEAPFVENGVSKQFEQQEDCNLIQFYREAESAPVMASSKELKEHFISLRCPRLLQKESRATMKLIAAGVGREYLPHVLWSETGPYTVDE